MLEEVLSLTEWKKKREILSELKNKEIEMSEREFRKLVQINNKRYGNGYSNYYIAHSCRGYKLTTNWDEIKQSIVDKRKRAITMLVECNNAEKQFQRRNNLMMELDDKL